jgi:hypothetical protein
MSKRDSGESDSLELLLDTICNMFGGVLFIAMLLAVLTGVKGEGVAKSAGVESIAEASDLRAKLIQLEHEVPGLEAAAQSLQSRAPSDSLNIGDLSTRLDGDLKDAETRLAEAKKTLESLRQREQDFNSELSAAAENTSRITRSNNELKEQIAREQQSKVADARLPVTRRTEKQPLHLILKGGRIYEVFRFDPENGIGINTQDVTSQDIGDNVLITPRSDAGFPPTTSLARHPRWRNIVAYRTSNRYFLYLMVYPDSFDVFRSLRVESMRAGYEYDLVILPPAQQVILTPADEFNTQ